MDRSIFEADRMQLLFEKERARVLSLEAGNTKTRDEAIQVVKLLDSVGDDVKVHVREVLVKSVKLLSEIIARCDNRRPGQTR
jgi:hypothetical protein